MSENIPTNKPDPRRGAADNPPGRPASGSTEPAAAPSSSPFVYSVEWDTSEWRDAE